MKNLTLKNESTTHEFIHNITLALLRIQQSTMNDNWRDEMFTSIKTFVSFHVARLYLAYEEELKLPDDTIQLLYSVEVITEKAHHKCARNHTISLVAKNDR